MAACTRSALTLFVPSRRGLKSFPATAPCVPSGSVLAFADGAGPEAVTTTRLSHRTQPQPRRALLPGNPPWRGHVASAVSDAAAAAGASAEAQSSALCLAALAELQEVFLKLSAAEADPCAALRGEILKCRSANIVLYGVGREGLMMRALAMRLFHLGLSASVVGDMSAPAVGEGDLFIASAGPGSFSTVNALLRVASAAGARTVLLTAQPQGPAAQLADSVVYLPGQTMVDDVAQDGQVSGRRRPAVLPMGSVYEGALFILCEVVVQQLRDCLQETPEAMRSRHTNLE